MYDLCLKALKSERVPYGEENGCIYTPFTSKDGIRTSVKVETYEAKQVIIEIWWVDETIPEDKLNTVLEFIGRVNTTKAYSHLRLDFNDMTLGVMSSNLFNLSGQKLDYDIVKDVLMTQIVGDTKLFNCCSPSFLEILYDDIDAETAFQKFRELDEKY